jgi:hypothetical protein
MATGRFGVGGGDDSGYSGGVPAKKKVQKPLEGAALVKEVNRRIRLARSHWDAHRNKACRRERDSALALYETLTQAQKEKVPQTLRVWLKYRSEKYFGEDRTKPGK